MQRRPSTATGALGRFPTYLGARLCRPQLPGSPSGPASTRNRTAPASERRGLALPLVVRHATASPNARPGDIHFNQACALAADRYGVTGDTPAADRTLDLRRERDAGHRHERLDGKSRRPGSPDYSLPLPDDPELAHKPGHELPAPVEFHGSEEPPLLFVRGANGPSARFAATGTRAGPSPSPRQGCSARREPRLRPALRHPLAQIPSTHDRHPPRLPRRCRVECLRRVTPPPPRPLRWLRGAGRRRGRLPRPGNRRPPSPALRSRRRLPAHRCGCGTSS